MLADFSPIAFFAFNRPQHTLRTLAALAANAEAANTDLHVFVDGGRDDAEREATAKVLQIAHAASGFRQVVVYASEFNQGLFRAITTGVSSVLKTSTAVIVVEDDILVSPHFLRYMNDGLRRYQAVPAVGSIHGYSPPIAGLPDYFFLPGADCWGWATWADRWALFQPEPHDLLATLVSRRLLTDFSRSHGYQSLLQLVKRARGRSQSWAILWHASLFLDGRYTLHPGHSLVANIGNDGTGIHAANRRIHDTVLADGYVGLPELAIEEDRAAADALGAFLDAEASGKAVSLRRWLLPTYAKLAARITCFLP